MDWLRSPLTLCDGSVVREPLDPDVLNDSDLKEICFRMHVILETIEMPHADMRFMPVDIFDQVDTLESRVRHGPVPRLSDWTELIRRFGEHYQLDGNSPIEIRDQSFHHFLRRFGFVAS